MNDRLLNPVIRRSGQAGRGFTLVEALFAILLVGLSIAGLTAANFAYSKANGAAVDISTAEYLIEQIRELTATKTVDELFQTAWRPAANAPIDAQGAALPAGFNVWTQQVQVVYVNKSDLVTVSGSDTGICRVTVHAIKANQAVSSTSWLRTRH